MRKRILYIFLAILGTILLNILLIVLILVYSVHPRQYVTTDLNDYGYYQGNYDDEYVQTFITSFFPEKIADNWTDVNYSYRAQKNDTYAFEAYLEFQIEDPEEFQNFIHQYTGGDVHDFQYDSSFKEYVIADNFNLTDSNSNHIESCNIGKILYSEESQRIIFIAMGVYDGGATTTEFLCVYFNRFNIDPKNY